MNAVMPTTPPVLAMARKRSSVIVRGFPRPQSARVGMATDDGSLGDIEYIERRRFAAVPADVDHDAEFLKLADDLHAEVAEAAGLRVDATGADVVADVVGESGTSQTQIMETK